MQSLYFIPCTFKPTEQSETVYGFAVCTSPDDVETFIYPNGKPYLSNEVWTYKLQHYSPWGQFEIVNDKC